MVLVKWFVWNSCACPGKSSNLKGGLDMRLRISIVALISLAFIPSTASFQEVGDEAKSQKRLRLGDEVLRPITVAASRMGREGIQQPPSDATASAIPGQINYQGYLTDVDGNPVSATLSMTFAIYDAPAGGSHLWTESQTVVVEDGLFGAILGSISPIPAGVFSSGTERYLEHKIDSQALSPRTKLTSVGYAYISTFADSAASAGRVGGASLPELDDRYLNRIGPEEITGSETASPILQVINTTGGRRLRARRTTLHPVLPMAARATLRTPAQVLPTAAISAPQSTGTVPIMDYGRADTAPPREL